MASRAADIMTKDVTVIQEDETLREAAERLASDDIGVLPICDSNKQIRGVLTDRDIVVHVIARGKDPANTRASELEQGEIVTLRPEDSIEHACDLMAQYKVRRLPVVENGRVVGMVSQADVAKSVSPEQAGRMLTQISTG
ncbi:MAG TPA: CBS domain-containing protein [Candidatus Baltobacteraceae bacterium]|jgi:CBS domain-containing protein|nr:CBS domain-containing protein [Candidatus Baltobacteraceae bacterium]